MKNIISISITFFLCSIVYSQKQPETIRKVYINLETYNKTYDRPLTKRDTLNFLFKDNDTLVLIENQNYKRKIGVAVPYEYKDSTFLHYYKKIAFNHPKDSVNKNTTMKYWKDDIRIFFSKSVSKKTRKDLMSFAKTIDKAVDSLSISEVKKVEDSNYVIYYFGDYDYEAKLSNIKNSSDYSWWNHNKLYRHSIKLDTKKYFSEQLIQYKLRDYFIKSLGYFNLIKDFDCESYFSDCYSANKKLTELDIELLKYHYSYGICKGTSLETFEEQHKKAKEILSNDGHSLIFIHED
jgi:hypothetical protein